MTSTNVKTDAHIDNIVELTELEQTVLRDGGPVFAEVQTENGSEIACFLLSCSWNTETRDEMNGRGPADFVVTLTGTETQVNVANTPREVGRVNGARILLDSTQ